MEAEPGSGTPVGGGSGTRGSRRSPAPQSPAPQSPAARSSAPPPRAAWPAPGAPFPYRPLPPPPTPRKTRIPRRHLAGAALALVAGLTLAGVSLAHGLSKTGRPAPPTAAELRDEKVRALWRDQPVDAVVPPVVAPAKGGDSYLRLGVAAGTGCDVLPADFRARLANDAPGTTCVAVLRATYTDATRTVFVTVGVVVVGGTPQARDQVWRQWEPGSDAERVGMMPGVYPVPGTVAASFADPQRVTWSSQTSKDGTYLVYAVSGFADGRAGSTPDQIANASGRALAADSPPVQAAADLSVALAARLDQAAGAVS